MLIKFYTEGCAPCYALSVLLDAKMIEYEAIDISKNINQAIKHKVRSVPTLLNTETGARLMGFKDKQTVEEWLDDNQG
tara:strand:+ start:274 stop:507 length:234 start_codon:yes stop_codon:yes gene_type:complete